MYAQTHPALAHELARVTMAGWTIEYQDGTSAVVVKRPRVNHVAHALVSLLTLGLWLIPWLLIAVTSRPQRRRITVDASGKVQGVPQVLVIR